MEHLTDTPRASVDEDVVPAPSRGVEKVAVYLTKQELGVLRRLIVEEAKRLNLGRYQHSSEWPSIAKRMRSVSQKIWEARQHFG